jgi:hypothetical protein
MEAKQKDKRCLRDAISTEFNLIKTSETIGGALTHLGVLIAKVRRQSHIDCIIASAETELAEEDRIAFENLEKAVAWFHEKIRILLPHVRWMPDSFERADVSALLNFHTLSFNAKGYAGSLLFQLRHLYSEVAKEEKHRSLFDGWMRTERKHSYSVEVFDWPDYVDKSLNSLPPDQQLHQWKERADTSLSCLLRFLKILSLYPSFIPLTLSACPTVDSLPKNLIQLEEWQYRATVGYYLSAFRSPDPTKHPLSIVELIKLLDRFLYMLEQRLEFDIPNDEKSSIQVKIVINQFFFFSERAKTGAATTQSTSQESVEPAPSDVAKKAHGHTWKEESDQKALYSIGKEIWRQAVRNVPLQVLKNLSQNDIGNKIRQEVKARGIRLYRDAPARYSKAAKATDPRHWENGRCLGFKKGYSTEEGGV